MRIVLTLVAMVGAWFLGRLAVRQIYAMNFDVPGVELSADLALYGIVGLIGLLAWAKLK